MVDVNDVPILSAIENLIELCGESPDTFEADLVVQMIQTCLRLMTEGYDTGQLKLVMRTLKEMRYAYNIFNIHKKNSRCVSIFGSARTPEDHPDYLAAKGFSAEMAEKGWMCITGGANGIMKAGLEGPKNKESIFGLSIRLPFETYTNTVIEGDPKLIIFRFFFTRKLMFLSHSDAIAVFPGGFGTLDELFEVLTLIQTGKTSIVPIVLMEGKGGVYWKNWENYLKTHLLANGWIYPEDRHLYYITTSIEEGAKHVRKFYRRYHSSRYVKDWLIIRMVDPLTQMQIEDLQVRFSALLQSGTIQMGAPFPEETDFLDLPRLIFHHTRKNFGLLRAMIDAINDY